MNKVSTVKEAVDNWIKSEAHRNNLLSEKREYVGFGLYSYVDKKGYSYYYWAQCFASF
jgi:uncharacterized protein YkwD